MKPPSHWKKKIEMFDFLDGPEKEVDHPKGGPRSSGGNLQIFLPSSIQKSGPRDGPLLLRRRRGFAKDPNVAPARNDGESRKPNLKVPSRTTREQSRAAGEQLSILLQQS